MDSELIDKIKQEAIWLSILFIVSAIVLKIIFFRENISVVMRTAAAFFWIFVLPGFAILFYWHEKIPFLERFVAGILLSAAITGISSYYLGLAGINIMYHSFILPIAIIAVSVFLIWKKS